MELRLRVGHARAAKIRLARPERQAFARHAGIVLQRQDDHVDRTLIVHERGAIRALEAVSRKKTGEPRAARIELLLHVKLVLLDNRFDHAARDPDVLLVRAALVLGKAQLDGKILRIAGAQRVLGAEVQARRRREHDEHHRGQNAHGCETRAVALHAVGHGGNGDEVVFLIVIPLVLLQRAAQQDGAGNEDQIRPHDDHQNGNEEHGQRRQRLLDRHGNIICRAEDPKAGKAERPVRLRRLFAVGFAAQQGRGVRPADRHQRAQEQKRENAEIQDRRHRRGRDRDGKVHLHVAAHDVDEHQLKQLPERNAQRLAAHDGHERHHDRFPGEHPGKIPLAHAEDVVEAELAVSAADEEGIRIKQEQNGERRHDEAAHAQDHRHDAAARERLEDRGGRQREQDVRHHHHADAG